MLRGLGPVMRLAAGLTQLLVAFVGAGKLNSEQSFESLIPNGTIAASKVEQEQFFLLGVPGI